MEKAENDFCTFVFSIKLFMNGLLLFNKILLFLQCEFKCSRQVFSKLNKPPFKIQYKIIKFNCIKESLI